MTETRDQGFPEFYAKAPVITVRDPLAQFLGAARHGLIEYCYTDVVRLAGHSCPTVAGAYLMALHGLRALYGSETPVRGDVEVFMHGAPGSGVTGVIASVVQLVTGAAPETGFPGAGSLALFARKNLLTFGADVDGVLGMRRRDTGKAVTVHHDSAIVPWPDEMRPLVAKAFSEQANSAELERFGQLWQERVRRMLVEDHADNPALVWVNDWHPAQ
ncbi:MAG: FmdE family protein [Giesbergeria sp.]